MHLEILLPFGVFSDTRLVLRMVAETTAGSLGLLPRRLDCVAALVPGVLEYETEAAGIVYVALDEGVLVKTGHDVTISVRRAMAGDDLGLLHHQVEEEYLSLSNEEKCARSVMAKLEVGFLHRFAEMQHG